MNFTESQLARWAASPSQSEQERMENAEQAIKNAIGASQKLRGRDIRIFAQGSYRNRVNVRSESDVDIAVVCSNSFFWDGPPDSTLATFGYSPASYKFDTFRFEVQDALIAYFGDSHITPGDKAFDVKANTYRVEADVAPFFEHRRFSADGYYTRGVEMRTRAGNRIINWPDQHYANGVAKNKNTSRSYKGCVRILKTLRYAMVADGIRSARETTSFLMECLMWNVPNEALTLPTWTEAMRHALAHLFNNTMREGLCSEWGEVSELKYLFRSIQPWTIEGTHKFLSDCWDYIGLE